MYAIKGDFISTLKLVNLLPKNFTINSGEKKFKFNKEWLTVISEYFYDIFSDFELTEIELPNYEYLDNLIIFLNVGEYKSNDLIEILELIVLIKKYLIKDVDIIKNLHNLIIPHNFFCIYIEYLNKIFDNNLTLAVDLIAKQIKPETDLSLLNPSILELIDSSPYKRHYGDRNMTLLVKELEKIAESEKNKVLKRYIFDFYNIGKSPSGFDYGYINLNMIYESHSVAEAVLKFRDYIIYSITHSINNKKHIKYKNYLDQTTTTPNCVKVPFYEKDIFRSYVLRYLNLIHTDIKYLSQGSIEEIEQKINGIIILGGFRIIELE